MVIFNNISAYYNILDIYTVIKYKYDKRFISHSMSGF